MGDSRHVFDWLQDWYAAQCDGDWEHERGLEIGTLDNPGWTVSIDLEGTALEDREYRRRDVDRSEDDWIRAWTAEGVFRAACGPGNLTEALTLFRSWAAQNAG